MSIPNHQEHLEKARVRIARKVHELRTERRWTQAELSRQLRLSQSRLSEIERGDGSFTAEQFLTILKLFNVTPSDFATEPQRHDSELQNALARLGALHLHESAAVLPNARLSAVTDVIREAIVATEFPRLTTALGPVLVRNIDRINLRKLHLELAEAGLERRLAWVVANTCEAIDRDLRQAPPKVARAYRRARVVLGSFLDFLDADAGREAVAPDVIDASIRSKQTLAEVTAASSSISKRWGLVTTLEPEDFVAALRGARAPDR